MGVDISDGVRDGVVEGVEEVVAVGVCVMDGVKVAISEGVGVDEINAVGVSDGVGSGVSLGVGDGLGVASELDCNSFVRNGINGLRFLLAKAIPVADKVVRPNRKRKPACNRMRAGIFLFSRWLIFIPPNEPERCRGAILLRPDAACCVPTKHIVNNYKANCWIVNKKPSPLPYTSGG